MRIVNSRYSVFHPFHPLTLTFQIHPFVRSIVRSFVRSSGLIQLYYFRNKRVEQQFSKIIFHFPLFEGHVWLGCYLHMSTPPHCRLAFRPIFNFDWVVWNSNEIWFRWDHQNGTETFHTFWIIKMRCDFDCEAENVFSIWDFHSFRKIIHYVQWGPVYLICFYLIWFVVVEIM